LRRSRAFAVAQFTDAVEDEQVALLSAGEDLTHSAADT
jgi:hypothetical protein